MKVKAGPPKAKPFKKTLSGSVQKKKFSKPTGGVLKNIVKITDAFEELKSGNDLTGISCSKEPKPVKKPKAKADKDAKKIDGKVPKNAVDAKTQPKAAVAPKEKKQKNKKADGAPKVSLKTKVLDSTEVNTTDNDPKLDVNKVTLLMFIDLILRLLNLLIIHRSKLLSMHSLLQLKTVLVYLKMNYGMMPHQYI